MSPRIADDSPSTVVACGLECSFMIWSAAKENAGVGCFVMTELVCRCLLLVDGGV